MLLGHDLDARPSPHTARKKRVKSPWTMSPVVAREILARWSEDLLPAPEGIARGGFGNSSLSGKGRSRRSGRPQAKEQTIAVPAKLPVQRTLLQELRLNSPRSQAGRKSTDPRRRSALDNRAPALRAFRFSRVPDWRQ